MTTAVVLALASLPVRGQEVESVEGGHRRDRFLPLCGRGLLTACALILGETGRGLLTATYHVVSVRIPQLAGEVAVTARGHSIDDLPPLTARGLRRKNS